MTPSFQKELRHLRAQLGCYQKISFGKYAGRTFAYVKSVDFEYTEWVMELEHPNKNQKMFQDWIESTYTIMEKHDPLVEFFSAPPLLHKKNYIEDLIGLF